MLILIVIYSNFAFNYPIATYLSFVKLSGRKSRATIKNNLVVSTSFFQLVLILKPISICEELFSQFSSSSDRLLRSVFKVEILFEKVQRNVINSALLMKLYNNQDEGEKPSKLFQRLKSENTKEDSDIFVLLINACANIRCVFFISIDC